MGSTNTFIACDEDCSATTGEALVERSGAQPWPPPRSSARPPTSAAFAPRMPSPDLPARPPVPVWSSNHPHQRLSRVGTASSTVLPHRIALTQAHWHPDAHVYLQRHRTIVLGWVGGVPAVPHHVPRHVLSAERRLWRRACARPASIGCRLPEPHAPVTGRKVPFPQGGPDRPGRSTVLTRWRRRYRSSQPPRLVAAPLPGVPFRALFFRKVALRPWSPESRRRVDSRNAGFSGASRSITLAPGASGVR